MPELARFDASRFVLVTSADFDSDTESVDKLGKLREKYSGDLVQCLVIG